MEDAKGAIYAPPKSGLPFLVVTFSHGDMQAEPTTTRWEARALLARRARQKQGPVEVTSADGDKQ